MSQPSFNNLEAEQAPGCFGSPSCHVSESKICKACDAYEECGKEVIKTLERIKEVINVEDLLHKHNQALAKSRSTRKKDELPPSIANFKPSRSMPKNVERKSKVEKIEFEVTNEDAALIETLPVKARPFAVQLLKSGYVNKIKSGLIAGTNALEKTGPKWLATALDKLIDGGFTRSELRAVLVTNLGWSENAAASHVSLAITLFSIFKIAIEQDKKIITDPNLQSHD